MNKQINKKVVTVVAIIALVAILAVCLVACNNQDTFEKRLKDKDYVVVSMTSDQMTGMIGEDIGEVEWAILATKGNMMEGEGSYVCVVKFSSEQDAKDCEAEFKSDIEEGFSVERSGKIIFVGTTGAVNDAK